MFQCEINPATTALLTIAKTSKMRQYMRNTRTFGDCYHCGSIPIYVKLEHYMLLTLRIIHVTI